jgi:hypothetical protein
MKCDDVDFEHKRLMVKCPKTERFPAHAIRIVPICPKLMNVLHEALPADITENPQVVALMNSFP